MAVAPHALAAHSAQRILAEGGTALEASVAMAAVLAVVYPHMSGIGGDGYWLIHQPDGSVIAVDGLGRSPEALDLAWYSQRGLTSIPYRGVAAMNTIAGTISGWQQLLSLAPQRLPLRRILADALQYAREGFEVSVSQSDATRMHLEALSQQPGFAECFLDDANQPPEPGEVLRQPALVNTLERLAEAGLGDFYRGEIAQRIAADLAALDSPIRINDLQAQYAGITTPQTLKIRVGTLYNSPPPTQGAASLGILGLFDRRFTDRIACDSPDYIHLLVEATKRIFDMRDRLIRDPRDMSDADRTFLLNTSRLDELANQIDMEQAMPWTRGGDPADTAWFGACDNEGRVVSGIQSLYHEFGSGVVLPGTGICWQNRCSAFSLNPTSPRVLKPARQPFHTLNPALAHLSDGRVLAYGSMGGDGQPQTQAAIFTRIAYYGQTLKQAIAAPRWLLGRAWGEDSSTLKLEAGFDPRIIDALRSRGHEIEVVEDRNAMMGHAGAVVLGSDGNVEGASDPRGDGGAVYIQ